ncbi:unnamed protein product [Adineta steineri]|uniref:Uncharacterized protein n=1 Tax=Adineta steineri TaxID=433720 RepID=A0A818JD72_9BILA|nr:unnamed protein product [Adineta steineri]
MTLMALLQIINVLVFTTPFSITNAYFLARASFYKDAYYQAQEQFAQLFFNVFLAGLYVGSFYCYYIGSKQYRQQVSYALKKVLKCENPERNRVMPVEENFCLATTR